MSAIVIKAEGHDDVIMISDKNPENASVLLKSESFSTNDQGFLAKETRFGLWKGKTQLFKELNLRENMDVCLINPVKLVVKESTTAFFDGQEPKVNPSTGQICTSNGLPIYRQTIVVSASSQEQDVKLVADKVEVTANAKAEADFHAANK